MTDRYSITVLQTGAILALVIIDQDKHKLDVTSPKAYHYHYQDDYY